MSLGRLYVTTVAVVMGMMSYSSVQGASASVSISLAWDPSAGNTVAGYHLYVGGRSGNYTNMIDTGSATSGTVTGLEAGKTYYFAVTAYDITGLESPFSSEVMYTIPGNTTNLARIRLTIGPSKQPIISGTAPAGYVYNVLTSIDLKTWTSMGSVTASSSGTILFTGTVTTDKVRFYRLQENPTKLARIQLTMGASKLPLISGTAPAGYVYNVLSSKDLKTWTSVGSVTATASGTISYTGTIATTDKVRYYRLQQTSP
jgi:fibronectin type 3 domain-containing protein